MQKISVIVPVYNEEKAIKETVLDIKKSLTKIKNYEIIVVDDGSKDKTYSVLKKISGIKVLQHKVNLGYGASLKTGIRNCTGDVVVILMLTALIPIKIYLNSLIILKIMRWLSAAEKNSLWWPVLQSFF